MCLPWCGWLGGELPRGARRWPLNWEYMLISLHTSGFVRSVRQVWSSKYILFDAVHADYRQVSQQLEAVYCSRSTSVSRWVTMAHQNIQGSKIPGRGRIRWRNANSWRRPQSHKYFKSTRLLLNSSQGTLPWILHNISEYHCFIHHMHSGEVCPNCTVIHEFHERMSSRDSRYAF